MTRWRRASTVVGRSSSSSDTSTTAGLPAPYQNDLAARINDAAFKSEVGNGIAQKLNLIRRVGNTAAPEGGRSSRYYQTRAIKAVDAAFARKGRETLVVMATGSGKTRTVIALVDQLMKVNWVKRVLFLADRTALVNQAAGAFKTHLPGVTTVNLVTEKATGGRVYVST